MEQQNIFEPIEIEVSVPDSGIVLKEKSEVAVQKEAKTSLEAEEVMKKDKKLISMSTYTAKKK